MTKWLCPVSWTKWIVSGLTSPAGWGGKVSKIPKQEFALYPISLIMADVDNGNLSSVTQVIWCYILTAWSSSFLLLREQLFSVHTGGVIIAVVIIIIIIIIINNNNNNNKCSNNNNYKSFSSSYSSKFSFFLSFFFSFFLSLLLVLMGEYFTFLIISYFLQNMNIPMILIGF